MPPPRTRARRALPAALAAILLLAGCGGGSGELRVGGVETPAEEPSVALEPSETERPTEEPTEEPTDEFTEFPEEPTETPSEDGTGLTEPLTPEGTELQLGENAVVDAVAQPGGLVGAVSYTITDVQRPGPGELDAQSRRSTVLVFVDVLALEGADRLVGWSPGYDLAGITADGSYLGAVAVAGGLDSCPRLEIPPGWTEGESLQGCVLLQSPPRDPMVAIGYLGGADGGPGPVTWAVDLP